MIQSGALSMALVVSACLLCCVKMDEVPASQSSSTIDINNRQTQQAVEDSNMAPSPFQTAHDTGKFEEASPKVSEEGEPTRDTDADTDDSGSRVKDESLAREPKVMLQAIGPFGSSEENEETSAKRSARSSEDESWTEQTDTGNEQKRSGGRRFFSLMNLIKFLLNPVIEEFQEVEKSSNISDISNKSSTNSSETAEKAESKNNTDSGKKTKFHCVGKNVTENTTALVHVVNSTVLLEMLSFDKNMTESDCVLVMFYAPWCHFCASTAPHFNAVGRAFPQLDVLAVDTVHFSNLNARFGTVAVPNIMLFHQSRSAIRFNHTERHFDTLIQFIKNTTGLEPNASVTVTEEDYNGPLPNFPTEDTDYLLWFAWIFLVVCGGHLFIQSRPGQRAIERVKILWQEHQHIE